MERESLECMSEKPSTTLAGMGLGHVPIDLPSYQHEQVRLYKRGTPIGDLIEQVLMPGEQNDVALARRFGGASPGFASIVTKIKKPRRGLMALWTASSRLRPDGTGSRPKRV